MALGQPSGTLTSWDHSFQWTGLSIASEYYLVLQTSSGTAVFDGWITSAEAGCAGGTACAVTPNATLNLANGDYQWRILDHGAYGYGSWTEFQEFTLK